MKYFTASIFAGLLSATSLSANADAAFVFQGDLCFPVFFPDDGGDPKQLIGDATQAVAVDAGFDRGVLNAGKATCQGYHEEVLDHAVVQNGACLFTNVPPPLPPVLFTENGKLVMSPNGNFNLFCRFPRADIPD